MAKSKQPAEQRRSHPAQTLFSLTRPPRTGAGREPNLAFIEPGEQIDSPQSNPTRRPTHEDP